ncbi:MAG: phosphoribosyl-ATP diphosphatase [Anaerolineae bacterium]|nr:phosphoribosyl-ATP diphosphatase [Anaerolineae bacterium]
MSIVHELENVIRDRKDHPRADSYTARLFALGLDEIVKKVGEESVEVLVAAMGQSRERLAEEVADLTYHLLVLLVARDMAWTDVTDVLSQRRR